MLDMYQPASASNQHRNPPAVAVVVVHSCSSHKLVVYLGRTKGVVAKQNSGVLFWTQLHPKALLGRTEIQGYFGGQTLEIDVEFLEETLE
jgi:hypothetical protein